MKINATRLQQHFEAISLIGKIGETGTNRPAHSPTEKEGFKIAASWMEEAGMKTHIDNFGNLIGRLEGKNPALPVLMMGSHLDSQPYGGRFDGVAGVLCAIEIVKTLTENNVQHERSIEVISFADEEGWRFNKGLYGSKGILGRLDPEDIERKDKDGISRREALIDFGCDPTKSKEDEYKPGSIFCFLELHIEQGPVLDIGNKPIGVVSGISGPLWLTVKLKGMAGHAGSVPMPLRKDALLGALRCGHLAAAWLDVTEPEPLPEDHPLRHEPNCYITPHIAGGHANESESLVRHFVANFKRYLDGTPLLDRVM